MGFYFTFLCSLLFILSQCSILSDSFDYDHTRQSDRFYDSSYLNPPGLSTGYPENSPDYASYYPDFRLNSATHSYHHSNGSRFNPNYSQHNSNNSNYYPSGPFYGTGPPVHGFPVYPQSPRLAYPDHPAKSHHSGFHASRPPPTHPYPYAHANRGYYGHPGLHHKSHYPFPRQGYGYPYSSYHSPYLHHRLRPSWLSHYGHGYAPTGRPDPDGFIPIPNTAGHHPYHGPIYPGYPPHSGFHGYPPGMAPMPQGYPAHPHYGPGYQGYPFHPGFGHPYTPHPPQTPTQTLQHPVQKPSNNLIVLDISFLGSTHGYSMTIYGTTRIFTANPPFLFGEVKMGSEVLWTHKQGDYPNKVVYKLGNGEYKVFVHFPPETTDVTPVKDGLTHVRAGLIPVKGIKPSKGSSGPKTQFGPAGDTSTTKLNINLSYKGPILVDDTGQSYINLTIPSVSEQVPEQVPQQVPQQVPEQVPEQIKDEQLKDEQAPTPTTDVKPVTEPSVAPTRQGEIATFSFLKLFVEDPNDARLSFQLSPALYAPEDVNDIRFASYKFEDGVKPTTVKYKDILIWQINPSRPDIFPKSVVWHETYFILLLEFDEYYRFYIKTSCDKNWKSRTFKDTCSLVKSRIKLYTRNKSKLAELTEDHYSFRNLNYAYEYVFMAGVRCEKVTYDDAPIYIYSPDDDECRYPVVIYIFGNRGAHVFYPNWSIHFKSPLELRLDLKNNKKSTDFFDYYKKGKKVLYSAKHGYGFGSVTTKNITKRCGSRCLGSSEDVIIWDGKDTGDQAQSVTLNGKGKGNKDVTITLLDNSQKKFSKEKKEWSEAEIPDENQPAPKFFAKIHIFVMNPQDFTDTIECHLSSATLGPINKMLFLKYRVPPNSKCTKVKYKQMLIWEYDSTNPAFFPRSVSWHEQYYLVFLQFPDDLYRFYTRASANAKWTFRALKGTTVLDLYKIRLYTCAHTRLELLPERLYRFRNLGFAFEYVFAPGARCESLTFQDKPVYTYAVKQSAGEYPVAIYVFSDKSGQVIYPNVSYPLKSPLAT